MSLLAPELPDQVSRASLALILQATSLTATGLLVWQASTPVAWQRSSWIWLIVLSLAYPLFAWFTSAAITLGLYFAAQEWDREEMLRAMLHTSAVAVWFAPALVLVSVVSPGAMAAGVVLVALATRLLYAEWRIIHPAAEVKSWIVSQGGSLCLQAGLVAALMQLPKLAIASAIVATAILTIHLIDNGALRRLAASVRRSIVYGWLAMLLATSLMLVGTVPRRLYGHGKGSGSHKKIATTAAPVPAMPPFPAGPPPIPQGGIGSEGFPGVILWPEVRPIPTLISPLPATGSGLSMSVRATPLNIPFSGEYWMFRRPYSRPPQNSFFQRGSPAALSFRTTDRQPMQMEAHHKLERPIELRCCGLVRVAIWNADHNPGQVALELSLVNTELAGSPSQSLGVVPVRSAPDPHKEPVTAVPETLEFRIPADSKFPAFNEFQVVFQRDGKHVSRSAKIAIDHFVLVPRGL